MLETIQYEDLLHSLPEEKIAGISEETFIPDLGFTQSIIVLDDDPTGTQAVHGVPVITEWSLDAICAEFHRKTSMFFILTNSRSLDEKRACALALEIGRNIREASRICKWAFRIISRSDSTLRGHYPQEVDKLDSALYDTRAIQVLIPAFIEGGRFTVNGIHYVREHDQLIPVADTPFAKDASFGFKNSILTEWVREKTLGRTQASDILSISLDLIRQGGAREILNKLSRIGGRPIIIVDAFSYSDLEIVTNAFKMAERQGMNFIYRTGASFVRSYAGITAQENWKPTTPKWSAPQGGLIVVGSYVPKTSLQLKYLMDQAGLPSIELEIETDEKSESYESQARRIAVRAENILRRGADLILYTSRKLVVKGGMEENLAYGNAISKLIVDIVSSLQIKPCFLVAKGGITSSDIATKALGIRRAMVLGQLIPGVPVWLLGPEAKFPGMPYFIFPGNVGTEKSLVDAYRILKEST